MAYFHYNFHCCTSFVLIYVRRYCRDFIFFTDEPFIMIVFIAPVLIVYYSPNTLLSIMLYALLFSSFGVYIFICVLKNLVYKKEMRGCVWVVLRVGCREIIWLVPEISLCIYSNIMKFYRLEISAFFLIPHLGQAKNLYRRNSHNNFRQYVWPNSDVYSVPLQCLSQNIIFIHSLLKYYVCITFINWRY